MSDEVIGKKSSMEPGYIWVPYVMAEKIKLQNWVVQRRINKIRTLWDFPIRKQENLNDTLGQFNPAQSIKSRYAIKQINNKFYGTISTSMDGKS